LPSLLFRCSPTTAPIVHITHPVHPVKLAS
jgi:hypothetical protein